jgi:DnaK suppressor protein
MKPVATKLKDRPAPLQMHSKKESRPATSELHKRPLNNLPTGPILAPVPTNDKPRKNTAGLSSKELEHFRDLLLAKRRDILGDMTAMEREALRTSGGSNLSTLPIHMADMGTDNYEQEFTLGLVESERKQLREINNALAKIQNGSFGICEGTGQPINKARLEVQPWARYSIEYAKQMERGGRQ